MMTRAVPAKDLVGEEGANAVVKVTRKSPRTTIILLTLIIIVKTEYTVPVAIYCILSSDDMLPVYLRYSTGTGRRY